MILNYYLWLILWSLRLSIPQSYILFYQYEMASGDSKFLLKQLLLILYVASFSPLILTVVL